jgi:hypothetical protein
VRPQRVAAYVAEGRLDLVTAGAPRASSYPWKRARWLGAAFPEAVLHPRARDAVPFGSRLSDLEPDPECCVEDDAEGGDGEDGTCGR